MDIGELMQTRLSLSRGKKELTSEQAEADAAPVGGGQDAPDS